MPWLQWRGWGRPLSPFENAVLEQLINIRADIRQLDKELTTMALDLNKLKDAVAEQTTVEQGAVVLLQELSTAIVDAGAQGNQEAVNDLAAQIKTSADALAAAIAANTPAAPAPTDPAPTV